ncbi:hypothetical protein [Burkholderia cenocepacia]|uniref:hypothetical protein n=1 Tax=Burkholderia cenocepacia TaxID=95486 RepID=UPI001B9813C5|nr:hypothetical protein [Burkholderia cenocepacia]MBR8409480.1 hypothetical protein [Burkholderia cenocepacia]
MNDTKHQNDYSPLTIEQIQNLAAVVREAFGGNLSRAGFIEGLMSLLEGISGFEVGEVPPSLVELAWVRYVDLTD